MKSKDLKYELPRRLKNHKSELLSDDNKQTFQIKVAATALDLPLFKVDSHTKIALFNMLGETAMVRKLAKALAKKLPKETQALVTPEVKSLCLAYELSHIMKIPYVVVRKTLKPYMLNSIGEEVVTITTGKPQTLWLDGKDLQSIKNKNVVLIDDVISTGSTIEGLRRLMKKAKAKVIAESAVFTEGEEDSWPDVIALGHLPVFKS